MYALPFSLCLFRLLGGGGGGNGGGYGGDCYLVDSGSSDSVTSMIIAMYFSKSSTL